jgi:hypothetical protein
MLKNALLHQKPPIVASHRAIRLPTVAQSRNHMTDDLSVGKTDMTVSIDDLPYDRMDVTRIVIHQTPPLAGILGRCRDAYTIRERYGRDHWGRLRDETLSAIELS